MSYGSLFYRPGWVADGKCLPANAQSTRAAGVPISACIEEWAGVGYGDVGGMGGHRAELGGVKRNSMALSTASGELGRAAQILAETGEAGRRFPAK